jgi:hypothetical protein
MGNLTRFRMPPLLLYDRLRHHKLYAEADELEVELLKARLAELRVKTSNKLKEEQKKQQILKEMIEKLE